ncbi:MAG: GNAT family N-acetyltransferase [Geminicoccaceae bacterium]
MDDKGLFSISGGFQPGQRSRAIGLFWEAFKSKLELLMKPDEKALSFFDLVADPTYAISACLADGTLVGIAGFKTRDGAFIGGGLKELCTVYGWVGGYWRGVALSVLDRPVEPGTFLMDGIFVSDDMRGRGVGSALLAAIKKKARADGYSKIRLDVIDTNPRARALYERQGFIATCTSDLGPLRHLFRFQQATTMIYRI